jgi:hypothetical protein
MCISQSVDWTVQGMSDVEFFRRTIARGVSVKEPVVACTLGSADLAAQSARWDRLRRHAEVERIVTADGIRLVFRDSPGMESELQALVAVENECCAWATWTVTRDEGTLALHASSTGEGIATLHAMFDRNC